MADREKVIKGLECHRIDNNHRINCTDCPYYVDDDNHIRCVNDLHDDAIELLKEQEQNEDGETDMNEQESIVTQDDIADVMNRINDAIEDLGYVAVGYDNTGMWLKVIIDIN